VTLVERRLIRPDEAGALTAAAAAAPAGA
jgi:hypothetical protein